MIKTGMLAATVAVILWIGWPQPEQAPLEGPQPTPHEPVAVPLAEQEQRAASVGGVGDRSPGLPPPARATTARLDINRATAEELERLPGIGGVLARRIIERRTVNGPFRTIDELKAVKGIGEKRMEQLRPFLIATHGPVPAGNRAAGEAAIKGAGKL